MKRKQLYAFLLAGSLSTCMLTQTIYSEEAAEGAGTEETLEEVPLDETALQTESEAAPASAETPAEESAAVTTEAPAEGQVPAEPESADTSEQAAEQAEASATPTAEPQTAANVVSSEEELKAAIAATPAGEIRTLIVKNDFSISSTVTVPAGIKICLISASGNVTISRDSSFSGDLFQVDGLLTFQSQEITSLGDSGSITIDGNGVEASGSLIHIGSSGIFGMDNSLTLLNNHTSGNGGAIYNSSTGSLIINGGTITGNSAASGGGIYTETSFMVSGAVDITGNYDTAGNTDNTAIANAGDAVIVGNLLYSASVGVHAVGGTAGTYVIYVSEDALAAGVTIGSAAEYFSSDDPAFTITSEGVLADPNAVTEENVHSEAYPEEQGDDLLSAGVSGPTLDRLSEVEWVDETTIRTECVSNSDGVYFAAVAPVSAGVPAFDVNQGGTEISADEPFEVVVSGIETDEESTLYVLVKSDDDQLSPKGAVPLDMSARPSEAGAGEEGTETTPEDTEPSTPEDTATPTPEETATPTPEETVTPVPEETATPTPEETATPVPEETATPTPEETATPTPTKTPAVKPSETADSVLDGIAEGGSYTIGSSSPLSVKITGTNSYGENPPSDGDTKWIFSSWTLNDDTTEHTDHTDSGTEPVSEISIKPADGISEAGDYKINFNMKQLVLTAGEWIESGETDTVSITAHFDVTADPTDTPTPTPTIRAAIIADVKTSTASGLTDLKLMPNTFYEFTVTGAGMDNTEPVTGDTRWVPSYWRMETGTTHQTTWKVGAKAGINAVRTIPLRIYFDEQKYDGTNWVATGTEDYITANLTTVPYSDADLTVTPTPSVTVTPVPDVTVTVTPAPDVTVTVTPEVTGGGELDPEISTTPTPTTRAAIISNINDSTISGITNLKLMPNTFYPFTVTGAGTDNTNPVAGDTRWVPLYWRMESGTTQQTTWRIGAKAGINEVRTIPIRVYLQEQRYNGSTWSATGVTDYITANVTTTTYSQSDVNNTTTDADGNVVYQNGTYYGSGSSGSSGSSGYDDGSSVSSSGSTANTGTGTAKNASTGDNTPIGTFAALAGASLVAGGAVIYKKRKRKTEK